MKPEMDPEKIKIDRIKNFKHWNVLDDLKTYDKRFVIISNDDDKEDHRPNCIINGELYMGEVYIIGVEYGNLQGMNEQDADYWVEILKRARQRALPLIREWDRGI